VFADSAIPVSTADPQGTFQNDLTNPRQAFAIHAIDATTHTGKWDTPSGPSYGAAVFDNGVLFVPDTFTDTVLVLDAETGQVLRALPMNVPPASPVAISGNSVYVGAGTGFFQTGALEQSAQILERNASVELHQRPFDDVLELRSVYGA